MYIILFLVVLSNLFIINDAVSNKTEVIKFHNVTDDFVNNICLIYFYGPTLNNKVKFHLKDGLSLAHHPKFNTSRMTVFHCHGWGVSSYSDSIKLLAKTFLKKGNINFVMIQYTKLIKFNILFKVIYYLDSVMNVTLIGETVGQFLKAYIPKIQPIELVRLTSHSIGGHIMGNAARTFGPGKLRLTGLDPAGPLFNLPVSSSLSAKDASFLDVIHTNSFMYSDVRHIGHVDFYPNGGVHQPGCFNDIFPPCSHVRAWQLFCESVLQEDVFPAKQCDKAAFSIPMTPIQFGEYSCNSSDVVYMGWNVSTSARGKYYLSTGCYPPYSLGAIGLDLTIYV